MYKNIFNLRILLKNVFPNICEFRKNYLLSSTVQDNMKLTK
jgi:hypothetical protein